VPLIALFWLVVVALAGTDESVITLEHNPGEMPDYVCVITGTGANDLFPLTEIGSFVEDASSERSDAWFALQPRDEWALDDVSSRARSALIPEALDRVATVDDGHMQSCRDPHRTRCAPQLSLKLDRQIRPDKYRIACAENARSQAREGPPRTLLMSVVFENPKGFSPIIRGVRLDGSVIHLNYRSDVTSWPFPVANVIGGDYVIGRSQLMSEGKATLSVTPACRLHTVQLPPLARVYDGEPLAVRASFNSPEEVLSCNADVKSGSRFEITLPHWDVPGEKTLVVTARPRGQAEDDDPIAEFQASWHGSRPPVLIESRAQRVSFSWRVHCMYSGRSSGMACPAASLDQHGIRCGVGTPNSDGMCVYSCGQGTGEAAMEFELPTSVRLEGPNEDRWSTQLSYVGQEIDGYVAAEDRRLSVDFSAWGADNSEIQRQVDVRGDRIHHLQVSSPSGDDHRVLPTRQGGQRLFVPGATCGDLLTYQIFGDRIYTRASAEIDQGALHFDHPASTGQVLGFNVGLATGIVSGFGGYEYTQPLVGAVGAATIRPWGAMRPSPRGSMVWFELPNVVYNLTRTPHVPLPVDVQDQTAGIVFRWHNRIFVSPLTLVRPLDERLTIAGGPSVTIGWPPDFRRLLVQVQPAAVADMRWRFGKALHFVASARMYGSRIDTVAWNPAGYPTRGHSWQPAVELDSGLRLGR